MKNTGMLSAMTLMFLAIGFSGCSKESSPSDSPAEDSAILALTNQAVAGMDTLAVYAGTPDAGIYMDGDGISPIFLADASDLTGDDGTRLFIRRHSFIKCLRGLSLTETQAQEVKSALRTYDACKDKAVKRAKAIYRELHATYKQKYGRIWQAYQSGSLTEREFKKLAEELRTAFRKELRSMHLKEKLDDAFRKCFREFLIQLKSVLTERQWIAFAECCRLPG
jgi:hypothetical protein